jgi:prenyltransferase beta subunit
MAWRSNPERWALARSLAIVPALCAALLVHAAPPALAAAPSPAYQERLEKTVAYLQKAQTVEGGFSEAGGKSSPDLSAWVALGLAAAGINPQDQVGSGGVSVYTYLAGQAKELTRTLEFERELLVVDAAGTSPSEFGGVNLVKAILGRRPSGAGDEGAFSDEAGESTPHVNDTIFAILALSPIQEPAVQEAVAAAAKWLESEQDSDGSWPSVCPKTAVATCASGGQEAGDVDMTGAAIEALNAAGLHEAPAQEKAFEYLRSVQDANGGFSQQAGEPEPNVASTAWVVQGMWSAGENPETWVKDPDEPTDEPLGYLASMQQEDGHIRYEASREEGGVWMTAYVTAALAGQPYPIIDVPPPKDNPPSPAQASSGSPPASSPGSAEAGQGGESSQPGSGVIAGGGGKGAPLFSRPQPQSQGSTPGGVRLLDSNHTRTAGQRIAKPAPDASAASLARKSQTPDPDRHHHGHGSGSASAARGDGNEGAGGREVKGVLIGAPAGSHDQDALEPGAPGLRSAGVGGSQTPWLAIAIGGLILLLILTGSQLERRRPQVIL